MSPRCIIFSFKGPATPDRICLGVILERLKSFVTCFLSFEINLVFNFHFQTQLLFDLKLIFNGNLLFIVILNMTKVIFIISKPLPNILISATILFWFVGF